jgi:hypothetical protein
MVPRDVPPQP